MSMPAYFEFLEAFIKANYGNFTQDNLQNFLESLVQRILEEQ